MAYGREIIVLCISPFTALCVSYISAKAREAAPAAVGDVESLAEDATLGPETAGDPWSARVSGAVT